MSTTITSEQKKHLKVLQQEEINGHFTYAKLAEVVKDENNAAVIKRISGEELKHYNVWKTYTGVEVKPNRFKINLYYWIAKNPWTDFRHPPDGAGRRECTGDLQ
jgi:hypothetical protein